MRRAPKFSGAVGLRDGDAPMPPRWAIDALTRSLRGSGSPPINIDMQSLDLHDVRCFVALASAGSIAEAASLLKRDPTSVSRRLQALEKRLGVRLAERTTRSFVLTEAGRSYLARVTPLLHEFDAAATEATSFAVGEPRGHLRVALPGSFARLWLDDLIVGFLRAHPAITLTACHSNELVDLIGEGFDAAIRLARLDDSRLIARRVATRRRLVCAAPSYLERHGAIRSVAEIADHDCLCFTGRKEPFRWDFHGPDGDTLSVAVRCRMASDDADLLVAAARGGLGLLNTTDWHVGPLLASGELVEVLPELRMVDEGAVYIMTASSLRLPSKTRAFSDWIAAGLSPAPWAPENRPVDQRLSAIGR